MIKKNSEGFGRYLFFRFIKINFKIFLVANNEKKSG